MPKLYECMMVNAKEETSTFYCEAESPEAAALRATEAAANSGNADWKCFYASPLEDSTDGR